MKLDRREVCTALGAVMAAWLAQPSVRVLAEGVSAPALSAAELGRFMERLTGFELDDDNFPAWLLDHLDPDRRALLERVVAQSHGWSAERFEAETRDGPLGELARRILLLCFTGNGEIDGRPVVVDQQGALAWRAAGIKPVSRCDPEGFGAWAEPPDES